MTRPPLLLAALMMVLALAGCGAPTEAQPPPTSSAPPSSEAVTARPVEGEPAGHSEADTETETETDSETDNDACRIVADLEDPEELRRWQIVNDGVMGGRSTAEAEVVDSVLSMTGEIVTAGGGFSSIRLALDEPLGDATELIVRLRTDGRTYELTVSDAAPGRDRRVSHQGPIGAVGVQNEADPSWDDEPWEDVAVDLTDLSATLFGRAVDVVPFQPDSAVEVGIILADGTDGPFRFQLDRIAACP
jgi:hypothetical protein